jgi:hypothetical protein
MPYGTSARAKSAHPAIAHKKNPRIAARDLGNKLKKIILTSY